MSVYYCAKTRIYASFTKETIRKILKRCHDKGYNFFSDTKQLALDEAIDYVFYGIDEDPVVHFITTIFKPGYGEHLYFSDKGNGVLQVYFTISYRKYVLNGGYIKDCISPSLKLLDITSDFVLQNFFVTHDMDDLFDRPVESGMFYVLTKDFYYREEKFLNRDAFYIMQQLQNIGCTFINNEQQSLAEEAIIDKISSHLSTKANLVDPLLIKTANGSLIQAYFYDYIFKFLPLEPWTIKEVDGKRGIDVAYYSRILLAMAEPFGIAELATHCNNAFYE